MGQAFNAFFAFIIQLFSAAEKGASALNNLATWADEASGQFTDIARHDRNEKLKAMMAVAAITELPKPKTKGGLAAQAAAAE